MTHHKIPGASVVVLIFWLVLLTAFTMKVDALNETPATVEETENLEVEEVSETVIPEPSMVLTQEEKDLIALVTMAEAEGEPEEGQRLVIDVILNRVDSEHFPDTVYDVVYQKNQFTSMWNGRVDRCEVRTDILQLVEDELITRTNENVVFFRTEHYSSFGIPVYRVGNHYFSRYE